MYFSCFHETVNSCYVWCRQRRQLFWFSQLNIVEASRKWIYPTSSVPAHQLQTTQSNYHCLPLTSYTFGQFSFQYTGKHFYILSGVHLQHENTSYCHILVVFVMCSVTAPYQTCLPTQYPCLLLQVKLRVPVTWTSAFSISLAIGSLTFWLVEKVVADLSNLILAYANPTFLELKLYRSDKNAPHHHFYGIEFDLLNL